MGKTIIWTISRGYCEGLGGSNSLYIRTRSLLADADDREIKVSAISLFDAMERLADKYNNLPNGESIGVGFDIE